MKAFFTELFQYDNHFNQQLISFYTATPEKISEKCIKLLSHILNVHQIWNYRILPGKIPYESWQVQEIRNLCEIHNKNFEDSVSILDQFDLDQIVQYSNKKGQIFNHKVRDLLFQIINHSTYHRAQIATEFRQIGLKPLLTDYIYYKMIS